MRDDIKKNLWTTADKLRANMDAVQSKHLMLGLIFLKYISDTFSARHTKVAVRLPVLVPPLELRRAFENIVGPIWSRIHNDDTRAHLLTSIHTPLFPRLISGQRRLPEAADAMGA